MSHIFYKNNQCSIEYFYGDGNPSKTAVFVFSSGGNRDLEGNNFGGNFFVSNGFDVVAIRVSTDDWFQSIPESVFEDINGFVSNNDIKRRVGMGASMGGYGAIAFSKQFQFDLVLAYSPQYRIDQDFDPRWKKNAEDIKWKYPIDIDTVSKTCNFFIIYDSKNLDGEQFSRLQKVILPEKLNAKAIPYSGHCSSIYLHQTGYLKEVSLQIVNHGNLRSLNLKLNRHLSSAYIQNICEELERRKKINFLKRVREIALNSGIHIKNITPVNIIISFYKNHQLVKPLYESLIKCREEVRSLKCIIYFYIDSPEDIELKETIYKYAMQDFLDIRIIENQRNQGFILTVNQGLKAAIDAKNDVVILNSDTQIYPGALREMIRVAYRDPMIGFVSPRSNNATICTLPHDAKSLQLSADEHYLRYQKIAKYLPEYSYVPTGVGFCLFIKWNVLAEFGGFDSIYGEGYNEENDLIMRANKSGYRAALANYAFVYHIGEATLSNHSLGRNCLEEKNKKILLERYPYYDRLIHNYHESPEFRAERLLSPLVDSNLSICFDFSSFGTYHNGTFEAGLSTLRAACVVWPESIRIVVCISKDAWKFHDIGSNSRVDRIDVHQCDEIFSAVIRYGQPFSESCISRVLSRAPIATFFMLDTIAADCGHLSVNLDENLWRFVMRWSDIVYTNSVFSAQQLTSRYQLGKSVELLPIMHSMDPDEYKFHGKATDKVDLIPDDLRIEDAILIIGNNFSHKFISETLAVLAKGMQDQIFVVVGRHAIEYENVKYIDSGGLTYQDIDFLYSSVRAIIFPTHYEGFGFPLMHALARNKPIYLRRLPPFIEIANELSQGHENLIWFHSTHSLLEQLRVDIRGWKGNGAIGESLGWHRSALQLLESIKCKIESVEHSQIANRIRWFELSFCRPSGDSSERLNINHPVELLNQIDEFRYLVGAYRRSNSWRVTAPFRKIKDAYLFSKKYFNRIF